MPGFPIPIGNQFFDNNGDPLAGGRLYSYIAGTLTPLAIYQDEALTIPFTNPAILTAAGRIFAYMPDGIGYKFYMNNAADATVWTWDNIEVPQIQAPLPSAAVPTGGIVMYGGTVAPAGWLMCDGTSYTRTTFQDLFNVIGVAFGSGSGTTFNVPDMRQRFPIGKAAAGTGSTLGGVGGTIDHTHIGPSHLHTIPSHVHAMAHTHIVPNTGWGDVLANPDIVGKLLTGVGASVNNHQPTLTPSTGAVSTPNTTGPTAAMSTDNGGAAVTTSANPPFLAVNFIIKT
jgi:microcystin-dependent protein